MKVLIFLVAAAASSAPPDSVPAHSTREGGESRAGGQSQGLTIVHAGGGCESREESSLQPGPGSS